MDDDRLTPLTDVGDVLGVTVETLRKKIRRGQIPAVKVFGRWRIPASEVSRLRAGGKLVTEGNALRGSEESAAR